VRVVLDTNIIVSNLLWRGSPRRVLDAARDGIIELYTSSALLEELEDVLSREKFAKRLEGVKVTARDLIEGYSALATVIETKPIEPVILHDPDDDAVLACALAAECEKIISGDEDLIALKQYQEIRILTATEFLEGISL
jgi:uncharacterized protein